MESESKQPFVAVRALAGSTRSRLLALQSPPASSIGSLPPHVTSQERRDSRLTDSKSKATPETLASPQESLTGLRAQAEAPAASSERGRRPRFRERTGRAGLTAPLRKAEGARVGGERYSQRGGAGGQRRQQTRLQSPAQRAEAAAVQETSSAAETRRGGTGLCGRPPLEQHQQQHQERRHRRSPARPGAPPHLPLACPPAILRALTEKPVPLKSMGRTSE